MTRITQYPTAAQVSLHKGDPVSLTLWSLTLWSLTLWCLTLPSSACRWGKTVLTISNHYISLCLPGKLDAPHGYPVNPAGKYGKLLNRSGKQLQFTNLLFSGRCTVQYSVSLLENITGDANAYSSTVCEYISDHFSLFD